MATVAGSAAFAIAPASASPTGIDPCPTIAEPGRHVLTGDIAASGEGERPCLSIESGDVTLDGRGHAVSSGGSRGAIPDVHVEADSTLSHAAVRDLSTETERGIRFVDVNGGPVAGNEL